MENIKQSRFDKFCSDTLLRLTERNWMAMKNEDIPDKEDARDKKFSQKWEASKDKKKEKSKDEDEVLSDDAIELAKQSAKNLSPAEKARKIAAMRKAS